MPEISPVAILRTPFAEKFGVPRQSGLVEEAEGFVEFLPEFSAMEFSRGLDSFSHLWLLTGFHRNRPWDGSATVRPPRLGGNKHIGVFASRSPMRPNGLGLSLVRLLTIEPGGIRVAGIDCVDGTPVYDLKPYLPWCESIPDATATWAGTPPPRRSAEQVHIPALLEKKILTTSGADGPRTLALIRSLLRLDPQPAYLDEPTRTFGMSVAGWNLRWHHTETGVELISATRLPTHTTHG